MQPHCARPWALVTIAILGIANLALGVRPSRAAEPDYQAMISRHGEAIVTLKLVMKMSFGGRGAGGDQEVESEVTGVMIDSAGLVLCSNTQLGGIGGMMSGMLGRSIPGFSISSDVVNVKLLYGPDDQEFEAKVIARDPDLDLAWIQVDANDHPFPSVDLSQAADVSLGMHLFGVKRMGKHFDRCAVVFLTIVSGEATKPRKLWIPEVLVGGFGLPVFDAGGKVAGIVVLQFPDASENAGAGGNPFAMLGSMFSMQDSYRGMILPAADVASATARARKAQPAKQADKTAAP